MSSKTTSPRIKEAKSNGPGAPNRKTRRTGPTDLATEAFVEAYLRPPAEYREYIAEQLAGFEDLPKAA